METCVSIYKKSAQTHTIKAKKKKEKAVSNIKQRKQIEKKLEKKQITKTTQKIYTTLKTLTIKKITDKKKGQGKKRLIREKNSNVKKTGEQTCWSGGGSLPNSGRSNIRAGVDQS